VRARPAALGEQYLSDSGAGLSADGWNRLAGNRGKTSGAHFLGA